MQLHNLSTVLFILSLFLLAPLTEQPETIDILPQTNLSIIKNIRLQRVILISDHDEEISLKVTYLDPSENKTEVKKDVIFIGKYTIDISKPGFYQFDFLSPQLTKLKFDEEGLPPMYYATVLLFSTVRLIFIIKSRYYTSLEDLF